MSLIILAVLPFDLKNKMNWELETIKYEIKIIKYEAGTIKWNEISKMRQKQQNKLKRNGIRDGNNKIWDTNNKIRYRDKVNIE